MALTAAERQQGSDTPRHVAIIMDGNGRWAKNRGWPRLVGHRRGAERVKQIVRAAPDLGIGWLTVYAFSTENWKRSTEEVLGLMKIFRIYIKREADGLAAEGVRMRFIGARERLDPLLIARRICRADIVLPDRAAAILDGDLQFTTRGRHETARPRLRHRQHGGRDQRRPADAHGEIPVRRLHTGHACAGALCAPRGHSAATWALAPR